jgi:hypothetical protein
VRGAAGDDGGGAALDEALQPHVGVAVGGDPSVRRVMRRRIWKEAPELPWGGGGGRGGGETGRRAGRVVAWAGSPSRNLGPTGGPRRRKMRWKVESVIFSEKNCCKVETLDAATWPPCACQPGAFFFILFGEFIRSFLFFCESMQLVPWWCTADIAIVQ